jgi:tetratricopeptide (TPR) repeat protein
LLALDDEAGQVAIRLRFFDTDKDAERAELIISYAGARLMGITDEERVEILDPDGRTHDWDGLGGIPAGEAWIMADELDRWADGRFVHRFSLSWPWYEEFAIEFADAGVSLNALSGRRLDLGRPDDALAAVEEEVALYRRRGWSSGLAWLLNDLSGRLAGLGRPDEALAAIEEAVALYHQVAASRPEVKRDLAAALNNLASRLADLDRPDEALAASQEAAALAL